MIKYLERELKDKNSIIKALHNKLDKQNVDIIKLNEVISSERANNFKVEISNLQRRMKEKERIIEENKKTFESVISEFKAKISNLVAFNDACTSRIEELELFNGQSKSVIQEQNDKVVNLESRAQEILANHKKEVDKALEDKKRNAQIRKGFKTLISMIYRTFESHELLNEQIERVLTKANNFLSYDDYESVELNSSQEGDSKLCYNNYNFQYPNNKLDSSIGYSTDFKYTNASSDGINIRKKERSKSKEDMNRSSSNHNVRFQEY